MKKMLKKTLILLIAACFFTQSRGVNCYALRPVASENSDMIPELSADKDSSNIYDTKIPQEGAHTAAQANPPAILHYYRDSKPKSKLIRHWKNKRGASQFLYTQKMGIESPTYIGVIGDNLSLIKEFAKELTLSGLVWKAFIKHNLLFVTEDKTVNVYVDKKRRADNALSECAAIILKAAKRHLQELEKEAILKNKYLYLASEVEFLRDNVSKYNITTAKETYSLALSKIEKTDKCIAVCGAIKQNEAEELMQELRWYRYKSLNKLGHIFINFNRDKINIESEYKDEKAEQDILDFIEGFRDIVIFSDTHIAGKGNEDNFGRKKEKELVKILDEAIARRSLVVINGDFMELWQSKYGNIKRAYPLLFSRLRKTRRIIYVAGNHDENILQSMIEKNRNEALKTAKDNIVSRKSKKKAFKQLIENPRIKGLLKGYDIVLSSGFSNDGIALDKDTFYVDDSILKFAGKFGETEAVKQLSRLIEDRLQNLHEVVKRDLGGKPVRAVEKGTGWYKSVEIVANYFDEYRRLYFEHGHIPDPFNYQSKIGRITSLLVGQLERLGWKDAEHDLNELLNSLISLAYKLFPNKFLHKKMLVYAKRVLALGRALGWYLNEKGLSEKGLAIFFGHTHCPVDIGKGPINALMKRFLPMYYANTGTWVSSAEKKIKDHVPTYREQAEKDAKKKGKKEKPVTIDTADENRGRMKYWFLITAYREIYLNNGYMPFYEIKKRAKTPVSGLATRWPLRNLEQAIPPAPDIKNIQGENRVNRALASSA